MAGRGGKGIVPALPSSAGEYEVGYGKPPKGTRFKPGRSGNPEGRPRGSKNKQSLVGLERLKTIVLEEAYREIPVAEGNRMVTVPIAQAVVRMVAAKGDHRSQRLFSEMLWEIERDERDENRDMLMTAIYYKESAQKELARRLQHGLPPPASSSCGSAPGARRPDMSG